MIRIYSGGKPRLPPRRSVGRCLQHEHGATAGGALDSRDNRRRVHEQVKLEEFIRSNMEAIVGEWESFARTLGPVPASMDTLALRDHAKAMLLVIADDIETYQSEQLRGEKSRGEVSPALRASAATVHGGLRFTSQFSMVQLAAEFRALRATVLRLWIADGETPAIGDPLVRFNEAIDQALAESIEAFTAKATATNDLFLGVLGHDLRAPLATISSAADVLTRRHPTPAQAIELGGSVKRAARHMAGMVDDLIGYTRLQLGNPMPMERVSIDAGTVCRDAILDAESVFSHRRIALETAGDLNGDFDPVALRQLMTNLFVNALQHGAQGSSVQAALNGWADELTLSVSNDGEPISGDALEKIFQPLFRAGAQDRSMQGRSSSGLGLFIAREVASAHGGTIQVTSTPAGRTTFEVVLPKKSAAAAAPTAA